METLRRYVLFVISLFFTAMGVSLAVKAGLGTSPISSVAYVVSFNVPFSLGMCLFIWNMLLLALQIIILRGDFQKVQLMQIPLSLIFAYFTDFTKAILKADIIPDEYYMKIFFTILGCISIGVGVSLSIMANVVLNSGEGFVKAISDKARLKFSNVKICFDVSLVVMAAVIAVIFSGKIIGVREGTVITAILTGIVVKIIMKLFKNPVCRIMRIS